MNSPANDDGRRGRQASPSVQGHTRNGFTIGELAAAIYDLAAPTRSSGEGQGIEADRLPGATSEKSCTCLLQRQS